MQVRHLHMRVCEALAARPTSQTCAALALSPTTTFICELSGKLFGGKNTFLERLLRGVCPNKVQDLTTPPLGQAVAKLPSLPMVQAIASQVDVDLAAHLVAVETFKAEGEQPSLYMMGGMA